MRSSAKSSRMLAVIVLVISNVDFIIACLHREHIIIVMDITAQSPKQYIKGLKQSLFPVWITPEEATLTNDYFWNNKQWSYEWKLDGERVLAAKNNNGVNLYSRNEIKLNNTYPELIEELKKIKGSFWLDDELVAFDGPNTSFKKLQERMYITNPRFDSM
jgi:ATP-dependent DNA ligase